MMKLLFFIIPFFFISCSDAWYYEYDTFIFKRGADIIVDYNYISIAHNKEYAIVGTNKYNKKDTCYFGYNPEVIINLKKGDHLIKKPMSGVFIIVKPNKDTLNYNYELKNRAIYCNGKLEFY